MNIGKAFREIREEQGLSRTEVAKRIGCTPSALSKIENGKVVPKEATIRTFCVATRLPIAYFYHKAMDGDDFGRLMCLNVYTASRLEEAISQLEHYQNNAQSGWLHEILYDLCIVKAELEGKERPRQENIEFKSWLGFGQAK